MEMLQLSLSWSVIGSNGPLTTRIVLRLYIVFSATARRWYVRIADCVSLRAARNRGYPDHVRRRGRLSNLWYPVTLLCFKIHTEQLKSTQPLSYIRLLLLHWLWHIPWEEMCSVLVPRTCSYFRHSASRQLVLQSESRYFCKGSIIADSHEEATGLMVITAGQVLITERACWIVQTHPCGTCEKKPMTLSSLSVSLSLCLSPSLSLCLSVSVCLCLSLCLSVSLFLSLPFCLPFPIPVWFYLFFLFYWYFVVLHECLSCSPVFLTYYQVLYLSVSSHSLSCSRLVIVGFFSTRVAAMLIFLSVGGTRFYLPFPDLIFFLHLKIHSSA